MKHSLLLVSLAAAALLAGCSSFKLGSVMYCASGTACAMRADPFRPVETVPPASPGAASAAGVPLVKAP